MINARGWLVVALAAAALIVCGARARADDRRCTAKLDCQYLKDKVATYGEGFVEFVAKMRGCSQARIDEARRKCAAK